MADWNESMRRSYSCRRLSESRDWDALEWSDDFIDITGDTSLRPRFRTRVKMAWDDHFLHILAELDEPHVWGTITEQNAVIFHDNDIEVFIDPDRDGLNYYEFEMNALGTIWELSLPKPYGDGGVPVLGCNMEGLKREIRINGRLNDPSVRDQGWEAEISFPWAGLEKYHNNGTCPPKPGDTWRLNFSRVQWQHKIVDARYVRIPPHGTPLAESLDPEQQAHPEDNWVWSPQGAVNMHLPMRWGDVTFEAS